MRLTIRDAYALKAWVRHRALENDDDVQTSNLFGDRVHLMDARPDHYGEVIAEWWNPEVLRIYQRSHPAAVRLTRILSLPLYHDRVAVEYVEDEA